MEAEQEHVNPFASPLAEEGTPGPGVPTDIAGVEAIRHEHLKREASIKSIGWLYYLGAVGMTLSTIGLVISTVSLPGQGIGSAELAMLIGMTLVLAALAALAWWIAPGLRRLNPTVRPWAIGLNVLALLSSLTGFNPIGMAINGYIIWLLAGDKTRYVFSPEYKEVIAATPHIKYKTSIVIWILLGLLLIVLALAVFAAIGAL